MSVKRDNYNSTGTLWLEIEREFIFSFYLYIIHLPPKMYAIFFLNHKCNSCLHETAC